MKKANKRNELFCIKYETKAKKNIEESNSWSVHGAKKVINILIFTFLLSFLYSSISFTRPKLLLRFYYTNPNCFSHFINVVCYGVRCVWYTRYTDMHVACNSDSYSNFITFGRSSNEWTEKVRSECAERKGGKKWSRNRRGRSRAESEWEPNEINRTTAQQACKKTEDAVFLLLLFRSCHKREIVHFCLPLWLEMKINVWNIF